MYAKYEKILDGESYRYQFTERVSLFGRNSGYIPRLLVTSLEKTASEPFAWHLNVEQALRAAGQNDIALIINLKPKAKKPNLSLYELVDVFGYSSFGWTPVMLYLRGLFVDEDPSLFNEKAFVRLLVDVADPIFSMTYLSGTLRNGVIDGRWTPPGPSPTNSVLLWPEAFNYFAREAQAIMDRIVKPRF